MPATSAYRPRLSVEPLDDRCVPATLSVGDAVVTEGVSGVQNAAVTVTLSQPLKKPVSVNYGTANGTATAGGDYTYVGGQLTFAKGETAKTILVPIVGDTVGEYDEFFYVRLFAPTKGVRIADGEATVAITDSLPKLSITEFAGGYEGDTLTFTVTLSTAFATPFTVNFTTADGDAVAGEDYVATSGTLTFLPGETVKTITVQTLADPALEYDESFFVRLSNPSAQVFMTYYGEGWGYIIGELVN
jgi:hypothetical protein